MLSRVNFVLGCTFTFNASIQFYQVRPLSVGDREKLLCDIDNEVLSTHYYILFYVSMKIGYDFWTYCI